MTTTDLFGVGFVGAALALGFAGFQAWTLLRVPKAGGDELQPATDALRKGGSAHWMWQAGPSLALFAAAVCGIFALERMGALDSPHLPWAFLTGGLWPLLAALLGEKLTLAAWARMVGAARKDLNLGLNALLSAGTVHSFLLAGLGLGEVTGWIFFLSRTAGYDAPQLAHTLLTFGLGAALAAFLLRAGGSIFFQSARLMDQGEDLSGSPRDPAAIVRWVGGQAGASGLGCDLYSSYLLILPAAIALGAKAYGEHGMIWNAMLFPLAVAAAGALASLLGTALIHAGGQAGQRSLLTAARKGSWAAALLTAAASAPLSYFLLGDWAPAISVTSGLLLGCLLDCTAEAPVRDGSRRAKAMAKLAADGSAATLLGGLSTGMASLLLPLLLLAAGLGTAYWAAGGALPPADSAALTAGLPRGLYGVALAAVGLTSTLGLSGATGALGPLADSLRGLVRQTGSSEGARTHADALDSLGCALSSAGRTRSTAAAALATLLLLFSYTSLLKEQLPGLTAWPPALAVGALLGALLPLFFLAIAVSGVQRGGQLLSAEVRRQSKEPRGSLKGKADLDYAKCVSLCARPAICQTAFGALLAVGCPLLVGRLLGPQAVTQLLVGVLATGLLLALWLGSMGGLWDSGKRHIEAGRHGGAGSEAHAAALTGDAVGAVLRDATVPILNGMMKLCFTAAITALTLFTQWSAL